MIHPARVKELIAGEAKKAGAYVLYWMQAAQRTRYNDALDYAIKWANELHLPVLVCFGLMDDYPEANARHYLFMLQGLADVEKGLKNRGIGFTVKHGSPESAAIYFSKNAAAVVTDRGYLRHQKIWRDRLRKSCEKAKLPLVQVETETVVPVEVASTKREFAARTIRPKIHKQLREFLIVSHATTVEKKWRGRKFARELNVSNPDTLLKKLKIDRTVLPVPDQFIGGEIEAHRRFAHFAKHSLKNYDVVRRELHGPLTSHLSPYLHFGQVSPVELAMLAIKAVGASLHSEEKKIVPGEFAGDENLDSFLEELIVRRELSINYCHYTENYDSYDALPGWAKQTLADHANDRREITYTFTELKDGKTHDVYWNAAQMQMNQTGYMHNQMRMYWGKKILEWSRSPREGFDATLKLNNLLFIDGRDCNSFESVAWVYGLHDRPWARRPIFGTVRYMNAQGLKRKFDIDAYVKLWLGSAP